MKCESNETSCLLPLPHAIRTPLSTPPSPPHASGVHHLALGFCTKYAGVMGGDVSEKLLQDAFTNTRARSLSLIHTHTHTHTHDASTSAIAHARARAHTHTHTHTHRKTETDTHTDTYVNQATPFKLNPKPFFLFITWYRIPSCIAYQKFTPFYFKTKLFFLDMAFPDTTSRHETEK